MQLKGRPYTDTARPILEIVRRRNKSTRHSVRPEENGGLLFVCIKRIEIRRNIDFADVNLPLIRIRELLIVALSRSLQ